MPYGSSSSLLTESTNTTSHEQRNLRSEYQVKQLVVSFTNTQTFARCSFSVNGLLLWNALLNELRTINDKEHFKAKLKTHLFVNFNQITYNII